MQENYQETYPYVYHMLCPKTQYLYIASLKICSRQILSPKFQTLLNYILNNEEFPEQCKGYIIACLRLFNKVAIIH
jgi:hypothetical protein